MSIALLILLILVFIAFLLPVRPRKINFDEKGHAIKVYKEELNHLQTRYQQKLISEQNFQQLSQELDNKTSIAITTLETHHFSYRLSIVPLILITLCLALASFFYIQNSGQVKQWQGFKSQYHNEITSGLFDPTIAHQFDEKNIAPYCFSLQQELLEKYDTNPDTLANLAACHIQAGYPTLAQDAVKIGFNTDKDHPELNYLFAESNLMQTGKLDEVATQALMVTLKHNPEHRGSLWLLGIASYQSGNLKEAEFFFNALKKTAGDNPQISKILDDISQKITQGDNTTNPPSKEVTSQSPTVNNNDKSISATISFSPDFAQKITLPKVLFIIVKSTEGQLINVSKAQLTDLTQPINIKINDNDSSMMRTASMSEFSNVVVSARISISGDALPNKGDYASEGKQIALNNKDTIINLEINQEIN